MRAAKEGGSVALLQSMDPVLQHHPCRERMRAVFNNPNKALKWTLSNGEALGLFREKIGLLLSVTWTNLLPQCPLSKAKVSVLGTPRAVSATLHGAFKQTGQDPEHHSGAFCCLLVPPDAPSRDVFTVCGHKASSKANVFQSISTKTFISIYVW